MGWNRGPHGVPQPPCDGPIYPGPHPLVVAVGAVHRRLAGGAGTDPVATVFPVFPEVGHRSMVVFPVDPPATRPGGEESLVDEDPGIIELHLEDRAVEDRVSLEDEGSMPSSRVGPCIPEGRLGDLRFIRGIVRFGIHVSFSSIILGDSGDPLEPDRFAGEVGGIAPARDRRRHLDGLDVGVDIHV